MENNNNQENIDIEEYNKEFEKKFGGKKTDPLSPVR